MKKYIKPIATIINVEAEQLICESIQMTGDGTSSAGVTSMDAPQIDIEDVINDLGGLDANGNLTFGWE